MKIDWDNHTVEIDGVRYLVGTAGSFIIACEMCGAEHFREARDYFAHPEWHTCFVCRPRQQMVPIRFDELDTKWRPFWRSLGWEVSAEQASKTDAGVLDTAPVRRV